VRHYFNETVFEDLALHKAFRFLYKSFQNHVFPCLASLNKNISEDMI